jgi:putative salt-induced outer membrane protein YdiY
MARAPSLRLRLKIFLFCSVFALFLVPPGSGPAEAAVLVMMNGDRLTGEVVQKEGNVLKFKTGYAGTINIQWDQVRELRTDGATQAILDDGTKLRARVIVVDDGKATITSEDQEPVTIEKARITAIRNISRDPKRAGDFSGRVSLFMRSERGNTETDDIGADVELKYRRKVDRIRIFGDLAKESKSGEKIKQKWFLGTTYSHFVTKKLYLAGILRFKHNEFADLNLRTSAGPFVGYQFFESKPLNLLAEVGAVLVRADYIVEPDDTYWGPGWNIVFDKFVFSDLLQFYHEQMGLLDAKDTGHWLWTSWTGLRVPLFGGLVGSAEAKIEYDSDPFEDTEGTQTTYRLKLGYEW